MIDFERQRLTMVETQLRPNEVTDTRLLAAMRALPRERFVPERASRRLPIWTRARGVSRDRRRAGALPARADGLARLVQLAAVEPDDTVLDIGCATGYSTAVLARLGRSVVGLEPEPELAEAARANVARARHRQCGNRRRRRSRAGRPKTALTM